MIKWMNSVKNRSQFRLLTLGRIKVQISRSGMKKTRN